MTIFDNISFQGPEFLWFECGDLLTALYTESKRRCLAWTIPDLQRKIKLKSILIILLKDRGRAHVKDCYDDLNEE